MKSGRIVSALTYCVVIATTCAVSAATPSAAHAQEGPDGLIRVVHGLRGLVADVYLDGTLVLPTFQPERSTDPLPVPAGDHLIEVRGAGAAMSSRAMLSQAVTVPAGFRGSLVAHLDAAGSPTLSVFPDDLSPVPAGTSRLVVRHTAAAGGVDVLLDGEATFSDVEPAGEATRVVPAGRHEIQVSGLADGSALAPPQNVEYPDGTANFMYLIGSQADGTLGWAAVQIRNLDMVPERIDTGDGTTARADRQGLDLALLATITAVLGCAGVIVAVRARSDLLRPRRSGI